MAHLASVTPTPAAEGELWPFQKETLIDFSEVGKCPQVPLLQMKLCMTLWLLSLISDLWMGNHKDPDVMETHEQWVRKKKSKIKNKINPVLFEGLVSVSHWYSSILVYTNQQQSFHFLWFSWGSAFHWDVCLFGCLFVSVCVRWEDVNTELSG